MYNITLEYIKETLKYGENQGYVLFKEIKDEELLEKVKTHHISSTMLNDVLAKAKKLEHKQGLAIPFKLYMKYFKDGDRLKYETLYFEQKRELHTLVLAEYMLKEGTYIENIEERLWQWCNMYSWALPAHTTEPVDRETAKKATQTLALFSAETGFYFAEILNLLKERLSPLLICRLEQEIERRILEPYRENEYWWERADMNWASVCAGSVGCCAMYQIEDRDELADILYRIIKSMACYISGFDKDGVTTEGLGYWEYGFSFYIYFSEILRERTAGKLDLLRLDPKNKRIAELPLYLQFPSENVVTFSDMSFQTWCAQYGILSRLEQAFNISNYKYPNTVEIYKDHTSKWALMARNIFWTVNKKEWETKAVNVGAYFFEESEWLLDRAYTPNNRFIAIAAKGGHNDEPHNHNDLGQFIMHYNGENLICDLGAGEYTREYFRDATRYGFLTNSSRGHCVPVINGLEQCAGANYNAQVEEVALDKVIRYKLDLSRAYEDKQLSKYQRTFEWDKEHLIFNVKDHFEFKASENVVEEVFYTYYPVSQSARGFIIEANTATMQVESGHLEIEKTIEEVVYKGHQGKDETVYKMSFIYNTNETIDLRTSFKIIENKGLNK